MVHEVVDAHKAGQLLHQLTFRKERQRGEEGEKRGGEGRERRGGIGEGRQEGRESRQEGKGEWRHMQSGKGGERETERKNSQYLHTITS